MMLYKGKCSKGLISIVYPNTALAPVPVYDCIHLGNEQPTALDSTGIILAHEDRFYYLPLAIQNIKDIATKMLTICERMRSICDTLTSSSSLLDNGSTVVGQATLTPSVVVGTQIANSASQVATQIDTLKNDITDWSTQII